VTTRTERPQLGRFGAWFNPRYDDTRTQFVVQAEALGYSTAWLGFGRASVGDLALVERVLDATETITVATAIVNMWTNHPADVGRAYQRIASRYADRFLLGVGIGHPESITSYRRPLEVALPSGPRTARDQHFQRARGGT
jgi:alkanesulfonate monooxygenase SsuD/methylene tetrahydromethanopterin reductase-like flavin-dependent oxidoreductase (luciferase family)